MAHYQCAFLIDCLILQSFSPLHIPSETSFSIQSLILKMIGIQIQHKSPPYKRSLQSPQINNNQRTLHRYK